MAVADRTGLPIAGCIESASPHEVKLVEKTIDSGFIDEPPHRLIGDLAYDSDELDEQLLRTRGIELIAPNRTHRIELIAPNRANRRKMTQDRRPLRRYKRRWKVERLFAWLQNFRRLVIRYERHAANFEGLLHLGFLMILLRHL